MTVAPTGSTPQTKIASAPPGDPVPPSAPAPTPPAGAEPHADTDAPAEPAESAEPAEPGAPSDTGPTNAFLIGAEALAAGVTVLQPGGAPAEPAAAYGVASQAFAAGLELLQANAAPADLVQAVRSTQLTTRLNELLLDLKSLGGVPLSEADIALHGGFVPAAIDAAAAGAAFLDSLGQPSPEPAPSEPDPAPDPAAGPAPDTSPVRAAG